MGEPGRVEDFHRYLSATDRAFLRMHGEDVPDPPKYERLNINLTAENAAYLKRRAEASGENATDLVNTMIGFFRGYEDRARDGFKRVEFHKKGADQCYQVNAESLEPFWKPKGKR